MAEVKRGVWGSKLGFILAASGSAIGLGNIIFFGANAYRFGGGAFYVPYLFALLFLGLPMMIVELGLGQHERSAFPGSMRRTCGTAGEFIAWWSLLNAMIIAMYYITLLGWVAALLVKSLGSAYYETGPLGSFVGVITGWTAVAFTMIIWVLNVVFLSKGTKTIEAAVKIFVPMMWVFMIVLVVRGLTLDQGTQGISYLFTPNFDGIKSPSVWQGACSQIFFSLSLGLGTMTAYASYLPRDSDTVANGSMVSFLNCGFEYIAGLAIFAILFVYALNPGPKTGTLGMSLIVIPTGIVNFPAMQTVILAMFFFLLVIAGLTSSISILESPISALRDKLGWSRGKAIGVVVAFGALGSVVFGLPQWVTIAGEKHQTLGLSFLELFDHWAFGYSLLVVGMVEAILIGHFYGIEKLRKKINATSKFQLGPWFDVLVKWVIPAILGVVLLFNLLNELGIGVEALGLSGDGFYIGDAGKKIDNLGFLPMMVFLIWAFITFVGAYALTRATPVPEFADPGPPYPGEESAGQEEE